MFAAIAAPLSALAATCGDGSESLGNGGFESPGVPAGTYNIFDASAVPPWRTTDESNGIEIWGDGFNGTPAFEGGNFAELNANSAGTLYQDVVTTPGATMTWTLHHRGRDGTDIMKVLIGDSLTADVWSDTGWDSISGDISDSETAWGSATGTYLVPAGQTCTRFGFSAVSSGVGIASYGNFLDDIALPIKCAEALVNAGRCAESTPMFLAAAEKAARPTPAAIAAATRNPRVTPPPTDTALDVPQPNEETGLMVVLGLCLLALGVSSSIAGRRARRARLAAPITARRVSSSIQKDLRDLDKRLDETGPRST